MGFVGSPRESPKSQAGILLKITFSGKGWGHLVKIDHKFNVISPEDLFRRMNEGTDFYLIDTLTHDHFEKVHLPHAKNACVFEVTFMAHIKEITRNRNAEIILYGSSAKSMDAIKAAEKLNREGYIQISILNGGLESWRASGFALEGNAPLDPDDPETTLTLENGVYKVDTNQSLIEWIGRNPNNKHFGTVGISNGDLTVKDGLLSGYFEVDLNSLENINLEGDKLHPVLIAHLKSDDFLFVKNFPKASFTIENSRPAKDPVLSSPNHEVTGTLSLRGVEVEQTFSATITRPAEGGLVAQAQFDLDRTRWGMIYGSARFFEHLGMHLVFDMIYIQIRIIAYLAPEEIEPSVKESG